MKLRLGTILLMCLTPLFSQQSDLGGEFDKEKRALSDDCGAGPKSPDPNKKPKTPVQRLTGCLTDVVVTGKPLHLGVGTIAPGNGVGFGPVFGFERHLKAKTETDPNTGGKVSKGLSFNVNGDAAVSTNGSWRGGMNLQLLPYEIRGPVVLQGPPPDASKASRIHTASIQPELNIYALATSLNQLSYYGEGPNSSRSSLAFFGLRETIVGANVIRPIFRETGLSLFGEVNGRWFDPRSRLGQKSPSIEQFYSDVTAPGLLRALGYFQAGEGARWNQWLGTDKFNLQYAATLQQFVSSTDGQYSFQRFTIDANHEIPIYRNRNREGTVAFRAMVVESFIPSGHSVPYYLRPTLGGSDINGDKWLPSYPDYRFRAPNVMLFRASVEHTLWKKAPIGGIAMLDYGRVAMTHGDLGFDHFRHSYGVGITVRAGNQTAVSLIFAFGGGEGTHTIANISPALFGGSSRPSLF